MLPIGWALRICAYTCYSITNNTNIAAVVVVVRRVAHLQRVVGNARASGGAAARRRLHLDLRCRSHHPVATDRRGQVQEPGRRARTAGRRYGLMSQRRHFAWCLLEVKCAVHGRGGQPCTAARRRGRVKSWRWRKLLHVGADTWHARRCPLAS